MIQRRVKIVDTNSVHPQLLHEDSIAQTDVGICERILAVCGLVCALTSGLVVNTNNHQPVVGDGIDKVLAAHFDWVDGFRDGRKEHRE